MSRSVSVADIQGAALTLSKWAHDDGVHCPFPEMVLAMANAIESCLALRDIYPELQKVKGEE